MRVGCSRELWSRHGTRIEREFGVVEVLLNGEKCVLEIRVDWWIVPDFPVANPLEERRGTSTGEQTPGYF